MSERDYYKVFQEFGLEVNPLPENYDPDIYGRSLLPVNLNSQDVSYSSSTDYIQVK